MYIVSYSVQDELPTKLGSLVRVEGTNVTFDFKDKSIVEMIAELPFGSLHFVMTPIPAIARAPKENEMLTPQSAIDNWGRNSSSEIREEDYLGKARRLVFEYVSARFDKSDPEVAFTIGDVYVVWFSKTLKNWKALVSTSLPDQMYYELTYDGEHKQTYLDAYKKHDNLCIPDLPRRERGRGYIPAGEDRFA